MKMAILIVLSIWTMAASSQIASTWKGNTPGHEKDWNFAANWSNNRIPDEFTDVIILRDEKARTSYPMIRYITSDINSITMAPDACIIIDEGKLRILDKMKSYFLPNQISGNGKVKFAQEEIALDEQGNSLSPSGHQVARYK